MTNKEILNKLHNFICEVTFTKTDGSERTMICTLKDDLLPHIPSVKPANDRDQNDYIPVFDLEENGWRAFKPSRMKNITFSNE